MTVCVLRKEDHDVDDLDRLASLRPSASVGPGRAARRRRQRGSAAANRVSSACAGPLVMKGYWKKPEETAEAFEHGWLHTGDVCREDEHGFFTIVDRKKDMIVCGGFNVFPREVEDVISTHPSVAAVAVIGVPDEKWGEAVKAVVVPRAGQTVDVEELIALVKEHKGSHHAPKSVDIVDSIPVSAVGKPDKKALRARYWAGRRPPRQLRVDGDERPQMLRPSLFRRLLRRLPTSCAAGDAVERIELHLRAVAPARAAHGTARGLTQRSTTGRDGAPMEERWPRER